MSPRLAATLALLAGTALSHGAAKPGIEFAPFFIPHLGSDFDGHMGGGISGAVTAVYDIPDSRYGEQLFGQFEGLYLHSAGTNAIGGPSHRETLDAGFGMLNLGIGARRNNFSFALLMGVGFGGGSLGGDTAAKDLSLDCAFQLKPRVCWHFSRNWTAFVEYRHLRTSSVAQNFFSNNDGRSLALHAFGLGVSRSF